MKQLFAVALVVVVMAAPASAQHGSGGHGGGGGGFHGGGSVGHGGFAAPGGFSGAMNRGAAGGPVYAPRYGTGGGVGAASARPSFYHGGWQWRRGHAVPYGYGVGVGYVGYGGPGYGWLDANDPGYGSGDDSGYDPGYDAGNGDNGAYDVGPYQDGPGVAAEGYGAQAPDRDQPPVPYAAEGAEVGSGYEARAAQPSSVARASSVAEPASTTQPSLYSNDAVTLIFKDGRAPEKIYNYAMTRTTLYVTDAKRQEIPIAALDLAATEKANRTSGVRFQLPVTQ